MIFLGLGRLSAIFVMQMPGIILGGKVDCYEPYENIMFWGGLAKNVSRTGR
jgi:hypothetical protein